MTDVLCLPAVGYDHLTAQTITPYDAAQWGAAHVWVDRGLAETDENFLQVIPYALLMNRDHHLWTYSRCGGDARMMNRHSCGVGGHVDRGDAHTGNTAPDAAIDVCRSGLLREIGEELSNANYGDVPQLTPVAWIHERDTAIGRMHIGLVYACAWNNTDMPMPRQGEALESLGWQDSTAILADTRFEQWSHLAVRAYDAEKSEEKSAEMNTQ